MPHVPLPSLSVCRCGHRREAHQHYRAGTDCASCSCTRFRPRLFGRRSDEGAGSGERPPA